MKLNLTNKKQHKNCQYFIKALKQIERHNMKQVQRPVFLCATRDQLKLAPSLLDFHRQRLENTCLITIKSQGFTVRFDQPENEGKVYLICSYKMLRAFKKNENKIVLIELETTPDGMQMYFEIENKQIECTLKVEAQQTNESWPQSPQATNESVYEMIHVGRITEEELKYLSMKEEEQIWIQFCESGMLLRNVPRGKFTKQDRVTLKESSGFNHLNLRSKLKNRNFINLRGEFFLESLYECQKRKRPIEVRLKNIYDGHTEQQIRFSYVLIRVQMQYGALTKVVGCFISDQMGEAGEQHIRLEYNREREAPPRESLLKSQEASYQQLKAMIFNRFTEIDGEAKINAEVMKERRPMGKIEQGEETFTRKYYSKY